MANNRSVRFTHWQSFIGVATNNRNEQKPLGRGDVTRLFTAKQLSGDQPILEKDFQRYLYVELGLLKDRVKRLEAHNSELKDAATKAEAKEWSSKHLGSVLPSNPGVTVTSLRSKATVLSSPVVSTLYPTTKDQDRCDACIDD